MCDELMDEEPRCGLCGVLESDQDFDFDEYKEVDGVVYLCLMCIETY